MNPTNHSKSRRPKPVSVAVRDWKTGSWKVPVRNQAKGSKKLLAGLAAAGLFAGTVVLWQRQNWLRKLARHEPEN